MTSKLFSRKAVRHRTHDLQGCSRNACAGLGRLAASRVDDEDRDCMAVMPQTTVIQAALDRVDLGLLEDHADHCVIGADPAMQAERTDELIGVVMYLMKHWPPTTSYTV